MSEFFIPLAGVLAGLLGGFGASLTKYGFDNRQARVQRRRQVIDDARVGLSTWLLDRPDQFASLRGARLTSDVAHSTWFIALRPHLPESLLNDLLFSDQDVYDMGPQRTVPAPTTDDPDAVVYRSSVDRGVAHDLLREIARLEKAWKLV